MSVDSFIPTVWSASLLSGLHKNLVFAQKGIVNMDYEGEITKQGDRVKINFVGAVSVFDVTKGEDIPDPEPLDTAATYLDIDQSKGFNFSVDDVDKVQTKGDVIEAAMTEAGYGVRDKADGSIAGLYVDAAAANLIGSDADPVIPASPEEFYDLLVDLDVKLDEASVPSGGRWCVVPPFAHGLLRKDKRFVGTGSAASDQLLRTGEIGEVSNLRILKSNNVHHTNQTKYKIMAGYPGAISYADQIVTVEAYRPQKRFEDAVKGLHVYGRKVVRPQGLAVLTMNRPA